MRATPLFRRFARDRRAVAAVEFALLLPVMMVMYLGVYEVTRAVTNNRKVVQLARTLADLTARGNLTASAMADIMASKTAVLAPYDATFAKIVVSAIGVYGSGSSVTGKVCSSTASGKDASNQNASPLAVNTIVTVPNGFDTAGMRYIRADVEMDYTPMLGQNIFRWITNGRSGIHFSEQTPWPVRNGSTYNSTYQEVVLPNGSPCPAS